MNWIRRLLIWRRIKRLENGYAQKRADLENLVSRCNDEPPKDFGITREIRALKKLVENMGGEKN